MTTTDDTTEIDELGPVDFLLVEFPPESQNFDGTAAAELLRLHESGQIRVLDLLLLQKNDDGTVDAVEADETEALDSIRSLEASVAEILAADDVLHLAAAMEPGTVAAAIVYENRWAAPFASALRRAGAQLVASGRIPIQAIAASIQAELDELDASEEGN